MFIHDPAWSQIAADQWAKAAERGDIYVPRELHGDAAQAVILAVHNKRDSQAPLTLHIDCIIGDDTCVAIADILMDRTGPTSAHITHRALSAGLYLAVACDRRSAVPHAQFLFHGSPYKHGGPQDIADAAFFATQTNREEAFWLERAEDGASMEFGVEEALEYGIIHEVRERV